MLQIILDSKFNSFETTMPLDSITVYGVNDTPNTVLINNENYKSFTYDKTFQVNF